jgi:hypothetical protein
MKNKLRFLTVVTASILVTAVGAATPHRIDKEDFAEAFKGQTYSNLLILATYDDRTFRISSEVSFVEELKSRGVTAGVSYDLIPDLESVRDEAVIRDALAEGDHDAILSIATIDEGYEYGVDDYMETNGIMLLLGGANDGSDLGSLIDWAGSGVYSMHVGLWDAKTQESIWQISTESESTGTETGDLKALADFVVKRLREQELLQ